MFVTIVEVNDVGTKKKKEKAIQIVELGSQFNVA